MEAKSILRRGHLLYLLILPVDDVDRERSILLLMFYGVSRLWVLYKELHDVVLHVLTIDTDLTLGDILLLSS